MTGPTTMEKATATATASSAAGKKPKGLSSVGTFVCFCLLSNPCFVVCKTTFLYILFLAPKRLLHRGKSPRSREEEIKIHGRVQRSGFERVLMRLDDAEWKPLQSRRVDVKCDRHRHRPE